MRRDEQQDVGYITYKPRRLGYTAQYEMMAGASRYGKTDLSMAMGMALLAQTQITEMNKKVYEYVAYYVAPKDAKEGDVDTIILNDKLIASSDQEARTKVIRLIPTTWDAKIADVVIEVRAFR